MAGKQSHALLWQYIYIVYITRKHVFIFFYTYTYFVCFRRLEHIVNYYIANARFFEGMQDMGWDAGDYVQDHTRNETVAYYSLHGIHSRKPSFEWRDH